MKKLWITYAWDDNIEGDFDYLVQALASVGVEAIYDRIALVPGRRLWEQIADRIQDPAIVAWAYLVTPQSVASQPCREELAYALDRTLKAKGETFPLIGLIHQVPFEEVPLALRTRLAVPLASSTWLEQVRAGVEGRPPAPPSAATSNLILRAHDPMPDRPEHVAVEARPRFGEILHWRFAVPAATKVVSWGYGTAGGRPGNLDDVVLHNVSLDGGGRLLGQEIRWFGASDRLTPAVSAYVVFRSHFPEFVYFAPAPGPYEGPGAGDALRFSAID